ncbi:MAG TPA: hypothetical protein VK463_00895 [Desulfomonilaceae bacterium]|nr:hypothetical protein [Desulfomonilaceae bacterium]
MNREFGDFQTPRGLVDEVLRVLGPVGERWPRVLEPTCGTGNFISGLMDSQSPPREIRAFELQEAHFRTAQGLARTSCCLIDVRQADLFRIDLRRELDWQNTGPLLVIGNPPWITSSELGGLASSNVPKKTNFRRLRGIEAITGHSNFDLSEHILIKLLVELAHERPTIAMLCKTQAARNVLRYAHARSIGLEAADIRLINASQWFNVEVEACLFVMKVGIRPAPIKADIFSDLDSRIADSTIGFVNGFLASSVRLYERTATFDGKSPLTWRQGIKHDAASVMELTDFGAMAKNRLGEPVRVESHRVYPLLKSSDLHNHENPVPRFSVIVTQTKIGEDTATLEQDTPLLWTYLQRHRDFFSRRKSSVYTGKPEFSMFGVGEYSFSRYKVAVAGFYGSPRFRLIRPVADRPVMLDDTCYFVPCRSLRQAALVFCLLNHESCLEFIESLVFRRAKRPVKKSVLQRIDLQALLQSIPALDLAEHVDAVMTRYGADRSGRADVAESFEELLQPHRNAPSKK